VGASGFGAQTVQWQSPPLRRLHIAANFGVRFSCLTREINFSDFSKENQMFNRILQGFIRKLAAAIVEGERTAHAALPKVPPDIRARRRVAGKVVSLGTGDCSIDYGRDNCPSGVRWVEPPNNGR